MRVREEKIVSQVKKKAEKFSKTGPVSKEMRKKEDRESLVKEGCLESGRKKERAKQT